MNLRAVVHLFDGVPEDVWVTDKPAVAEQWRAELDQRYGIERDDDGAPLTDQSHQVLVLNCYRSDIG